MIICEKCQDRGFTEEEHGLLMVLCDCAKGRAKKEELRGGVEIIGEKPDDDSNSGTEPDNKPTGSGDTGQPKQPPKPKSKKKAGKRTR